MFGVGFDTAAVLLVTAGDNPERIISEGAWAMLVRHRPGAGDERPDLEPFPAQQRR